MQIAPFPFTFLVSCRIVFSIAAIIVLAGCGSVATPTEGVPTIVPAANPTPTRVNAQGTVVPDVNLGAPVIVNGQVLWRITEGREDASAIERAKRISGRLDAIATNPFRPEVEVAIADTDLGTEIAVAGQVVHIVTDNDALASGGGRQALAQERADAIRAVLAQARQTYGPEAILRDAVAALITIAVLVFLLWLVNRLYHRWRKLVSADLTPGAGGGALRQTGIYQSGLLKGIALTLLAAGRLVAWFALIVVLFPITLSFIPYTRPFYEQLRGLVLTPLAIFWEGFLAYVPNLFFIVIIALLTFVLIRLLRAFFKEIKSGAIRLGSFDSEWADLTFNLLAVLLIGLALIIAFPYLPGSGSPAFQGITIFFGLLITLSSSSAISNVIAGIILTYTGAFHDGDRVELGGTVGDVVEKRLLTTRVRTTKNVEVSVPNSLALSHSVLNYSAMARGPGLILHTEITIGYSVPWRRVHQLLIDAALATPHILADRAPFVYQTALNDYHVSYQINCYTHEANMMSRTLSALHENIQNQFNAAGVEIMSPAYQALRDGNTITLSEDALPGDYIPQGFRVNMQPVPPRADDGHQPK